MLLLFREKPLDPNRALNRADLVIQPVKKERWDVQLWNRLREVVAEAGKRSRPEVPLPVHNDEGLFYECWAEVAHLKKLFADVADGVDAVLTRSVVCVHGVEKAVVEGPIHHLLEAVEGVLGHLREHPTVQICCLEKDHASDVRLAQDS
jgi:hypothetical protein